jgi:hypothetical protein
MNKCGMFNLDNKLFRYILQAFNYSVFMALIWYFSNMPPFRQLGEDEAVMTIAFSHVGEIKEPCRKRSAEELMALPPNMRAPMDCTRERSPVRIEAFLDNHPIYVHTAEAPGLFKDSGVNIYHLTKVPAGKHHLQIKMDDSVRKEGFEHAFEQDVMIAPAQILLVDFIAGKGFIVK